ncbi:MAG: hypothetical protein ACLPY1_05085 [Terracidiphilus sp.]
MDAQTDVADSQPSLKLRQQIAIFLFSCAVLIARKPDAIFHAQFYGEDGHVWFADAYNLGWGPALLHTWAGYFQTFPRIAAAFALLAPLTLVPLFFNLIAILVQALPISLLLSARSSAWGSLQFRAMLAGIYLVLPNSEELSSGITESLWYLALLAFLVLVASKPKDVAGWLFDLLILLLCGLTGPFCIFLLPIAFFLAWRNRDRRHWILAEVLTVLSIVQAWALVHLGSSGDPFDHRVTGIKALGPSVTLFARILASQIYLGTLIGGNGLGTNAGLVPLIVFSCIAIAGTALVVFCFIKSNIEMKLFLAFAAMPFVAGLMSSTGHPPPGVSVWSLFTAAGGIRYWFFPTLAFAWVILWCFQNRTGALKTVSVVLLCIMCIGVVRDWKHPAFKDVQFAEYAKRFDTAQVGSTVTIPENPDGWTARLIKRPQGR